MFAMTYQSPMNFVRSTWEASATGGIGSEGAVAQPSRVAMANGMGSQRVFMLEISSIFLRRTMATGSQDRSAGVRRGCRKDRDEAAGRHEDRPDLRGESRHGAHKQMTFRFFRRGRRLRILASFG